MTRSVGLCRPQLSYRGCYNCSSIWSARVNYQDAGSLAKLSLHVVYKNFQGDPLQCGKSAGIQVVVRTELLIMTVLLGTGCSFVSVNC